MAAFRLFGQFPRFLLNSGEVNSGGYIATYENDLSTPKLTYSDFALTIPNPLVIQLDAFGMPETDIWGDGVYGAVLSTNAEVEIATANNIQSGTDPGVEIPALVTGQFLTNNGSIMQWQAINQVPDSTGLGTNVVLYGDNTGGSFWDELPTPEDVPITNTTTYVIIGTLKILWGTGTVPAAPSAKTASVSITFPSAFSGTPYHVQPCNTSSGGSAPSGAIPTLAYTSASTTGCSITANIPDDDSNSVWKLGNATPFSYVAYGPA
jgi:hypothetical protein